MEIPRIQDMRELKGKRVLVRVGFNVPLNGVHVADGYRIDKVMPTIQFLKEKGAKVILLSHIGRNPKDSLKPIANYCNRRKNIKMGFAPDALSETTKSMIDNMQEGSVVLLQNLRRYAGEVDNDSVFAKHLASLGDIYVNDAFSVSHRKHASIVGVPKYLPSYAGLLLQDEIKHLDMVLDPKHPFLFMLGGAKTKTKLPLLKKFEQLADTIFVGGAIANSFLRARGYEIGKSVADEPTPAIRTLAKSSKIRLPEDVLVEGSKLGVTRELNTVKKDDVIVDVGAKTRSAFEEMVGKQALIVLNGPIGWYEKEYDKGTRKLLKVLSETKGMVILGGGDTVALVSKMRLRNKYTFISTGGGAMLDYLADGKLPGIDALMKIKSKK